MAVALAEPGQVYVVYLPRGGGVTVDLSSLPGLAVAEWFNPRTGAVMYKDSVPGGARRSFAAPDNNDWALRLLRKSPSPETK